MPDTIDVINPARFAEVVARAPVCSESDVDRILEQADAADRLEAGAVFLNDHGSFRDTRIEFPGIKQNGFSRESRAAALDHYADTYGFAE